MQVTIRLDDIDYHGCECDCGLCNTNGKSYGAAILKNENEDILVREYGPSEEAALRSAKETCMRNGWTER